MMWWRRKGGIRPYGYDWNGDRSSPDYDPQRDPWLPGSPVFGQRPRYRWLRDAAKEPIVWALFAWFTVTLGTIWLYAVGVISNDTIFTVWVGKYLVLFAGLIIVGVWSVATWFRKTPREERGPVLREKLKRAPRTVAWLIALTAVCIGLDLLEKRYGVPFLVSAGGLFGLWLGVMHWRERSGRL
jgi:hypothetical protein